MYGSRLPVFTPWGDSVHFIDIFLTGTKNVSWKASSSHPWIILSKSSGNLTDEFLLKEDRIRVSIDWDKAPADNQKNGAITFTGGEQLFVVPVRIFRPAIVSNYSGFIESDRHLSIFAEHYSRVDRATGFQWKSIEGLGYSGEAMMLTAHDSTFQDNTLSGEAYPGLEYDFYSFSEGEAQITVYCLPTHALNTLHQLRISIAVDNSETQVVDYRTFDRSETWKQNVLGNNAFVQVKYPITAPGKHTLILKAMDPGVVIDRITIDFGGLEPAYSAVPETKSVY